jgi:hypothetical protein
MADTPISDDKNKVKEVPLDKVNDKVKEVPLYKDKVNKILYIVTLNNSMALITASYVLYKDKVIEILYSITP